MCTACTQVHAEANKTGLYSFSVIWRAVSCFSFGGEKYVIFGPQEGCKEFRLHGIPYVIFYLRILRMLHCFAELVKNSAELCGILYHGIRQNFEEFRDLWSEEILQISRGGHRCFLSPLITNPLIYLRVR
jgi:hypothetical protein